MKIIANLFICKINAMPALVYQDSFVSSSSEFAGKLPWSKLRDIGVNK